MILLLRLPYKIKTPPRTSKVNYSRGNRGSILNCDNTCWASEYFFTGWEGLFGRLWIVVPIRIKTPHSILKQCSLPPLPFCRFGLYNRFFLIQPITGWYITYSFFCFGYLNRFPLRLFKNTRTWCGLQCVGILLGSLGGGSD